jgi:hypothetical protein
VGRDREDAVAVELDGSGEETTVLQRLRGKITYANVTATLALFIALGGTSYAALTLPRNSVGSAQIRTAAVRSSDIRDRKIGVRDLSATARAALKGTMGPQGPQGPAGASAIKYFASVSPSGALVRGNATSGSHLQPIGAYVVGFSESVSGCTYGATLGTTDGTTAPAGRITVNDQGGKVGVQTYDASGSPADLPFHLLVAC